LGALGPGPPGPLDKTALADRQTNKGKNINLLDGGNLESTSDIIYTTLFHQSGSNTTTK